MWDLFIIVIDSFRVEENFDENGTFFEYRITARNFIYKGNLQEFLVCDFIFKHKNNST